MPATTLDQLSARVGFIGLGLMGSRLAQRLHTAGWNIRAWNRSPQPAAELSKKGIVIAPSVADLVTGSNLILSSLANDAAVRAVYLDKAGVFSATKPGTIILEMSTISPELSRNLHRVVGTTGIKFLDVAISGSTPAVDAGTITLLAGGEKETFERCVPIFESIARQWFLIGTGSSGVQMKLVVNLLLGLDMQALAEAVSLGEPVVLNPGTLLANCRERVSRALFSDMLPIRRAIGSSGHAFACRVLDSCVRRNTGELEEAVSRSLPSLYRRAYRYVGDPHDAEDVVQDARGHRSQILWCWPSAFNVARLGAGCRCPFAIHKKAVPGGQPSGPSLHMQICEVIPLCRKQSDSLDWESWAQGWCGTWPQRATPSAYGTGLKAKQKPSQSL